MCDCMERFGNRRPFTGPSLCARAATAQPTAHCAAALKPRAVQPIMIAVEVLCWTFGRGDDRLMLRREETDNGVNLTVAGEGVPRVYPFPNLARLEKFQSDMEAFLLRTGWQFLEFSPERRSGTDRRDMPRLANDRRRWWTDGVRLFTNRRHHEHSRG